MVCCASVWLWRSLLLIGRTELRFSPTNGDCTLVGIIWSCMPMLLLECEGFVASEGACYSCSVPLHGSLIKQGLERASYNPEGLQYSILLGYLGGRTMD